MGKIKWLPDSKARWLQIGNVAGLVMAFAALVIAYLALRDAWRIAEHSGSFDKPKVLFGFGDIAADSSEVELVTLIPKRCTSAKRVIMEIPLSVFNTGQKTASNVSTSLRFPLKKGSSPAAGQAASDLFAADGPEVTALNRSVHDVEDWRHVTYHAERLLPGMKLGLAEPIEAPLPVTFDLTGANPRVAGSVRVSYSLQVPIIVAFDEGNVLAGKVNIAAVAADSLKEAMNPLNEHIASIRARHSIGPTTLGWMAKIMPSPKRRLFLARATAEGCTGGNVAFAPTRNVAFVEYPL